MPKNKLGRPVSAEHHKRVEILADWMATPDVAKQDKNLKQLAQRHGYLPGKHWYNLASSAEVMHQALLKIAGDGLNRAPNVLNKLADLAEEGHVKAAETYLDFVRKTITDEGFISKLKPVVDIASILRDTGRAIDRFAQLAETLGNNPQIARQRWEALQKKDQVVDAEFTEDATSPSGTAPLSFPSPGASTQEKIKQVGKRDPDYEQRAEHV